MIRPFLELIRPPNVATALADVLAGFAVAGLAAPGALPWLLLSTACLYAGGIVFNDVFDRDLDAVERPERAIPSGRVRVSHAAVLGAGLLGSGVLAAALAGGDAPIIALAIVVLVLLYDAWGKRLPFIGPVNMGLCRGFNLLLGMAAVTGTVAAHWPLALITVTYIAAVTMVSRGEVSGGHRGVAVAAFGLVIAVLVALGWVAVSARASMAAALVFTLLLAWKVAPAFWRAAGQLGPEAARNAVRTGVLSLVLLDAVIAAAYAGIIYSLAVLATAVLAGRLARLFAVT